MQVPLTISDFIERAALVYPDRVAVVDEPGTAGGFGSLTYRQLAARADGMAAFLDDLGLPVGARVGIVSPNSARFMVAFFGVSGSGRVLVPINFRLNENEVSYIVEHSGAEVLLVDPEVDGPLSSVKASHRILLDGEADRDVFAEIGDGRAPLGWERDETAT